MARFIVVALPDHPGSYETNGYAIVDTKAHDERRPEWGAVWAVCSNSPAANAVRAALEVTPPPEPNNEEPF